MKLVGYYVLPAGDEDFVALNEVLKEGTPEGRLPRDREGIVPLNEDLPTDPKPVPPILSEVETNLLAMEWFSGPHDGLVLKPPKDLVTQTNAEEGSLFRQPGAQEREGGLIIVRMSRARAEDQDSPRRGPIKVTPVHDGYMEAHLGQFLDDVERERVLKVDERCFH